jgi:ribosomal protein S18 acetylase RimI-like enzyme
LITIEPVTPANLSAFKEVRLRALQDTPQAFGSTYAREAAFSDAEWLQRAKRWNGETGIGFLAIDDGTPCGIAGAFLNEDDRTRALLVSMWTAPTHRRKAIGRRLVDQVLEWARLRNATTLLLMVTCTNDPAIRFYERLGFTRTGRTEPYPNDPALIEYEMSRPT